MKLQFKQQQFQLDAVAAIADIFQGQKRQDGVHYLSDPGRDTSGLDLVLDAYRNAAISLSTADIRQAVRQMQVKHGLKPSEDLSLTMIDGRPSYNLTIEMETGTGKTYTYIRTIMELNQRYGWLKFIIVVPSIAIREGVLKSFEVMAEHFQMEYGKKPRFFVYNSARLGDLDTFANSSDIRVMIINNQAFNASGKDARRIHMEQESFRWRKPIDVIAGTRPIMIIDEPQSVEGAKTKQSLQDFKPLMTLRYSATHKDKHDMVYRLDAMDAYNKKLVKKIAVKAIEKSGTTGTDGYLYLQELIPQRTGGPKAKIEFEVRTKTGIRRQTKLIREPFDLYSESGELEAYRDGWTLSHFDAQTDTIQIGANRLLSVGEVIGDVNEEELRRIQIRETIKSHLEKEERLYDKGIKVLSLFFIDEVAKYKTYDEQQNALNGQYATFFEEEYSRQVRDYLANHQASRYRVYLEKHQEAAQQHAGYFSIDKNKKTGKTRFVESKVARGNKEGNSDDQDAYDLIMKDKERLLSFDEPVRFIFSHSALKEGWDNPNVFQICTLKQSSAETRKRQEIGRGMRLAVNQNGIRQDEELLGSQVHNINKLTVIANESYDDFAKNLQKDLQDLLSDRPRKVDVALFNDKVLERADGQRLTLTAELANQVYFTFVQRGYIDVQGALTDTYHEAYDAGGIVLPDSVADFEEQVLNLVGSVYSAEQYHIENANESEITFGKEVNQENFARKEFLALWKNIQHKSAYQVTFDDQELVEKAVLAINEKLVVKQPVFQITESSASKMGQEGLVFQVEENGKADGYIKASQIQTRYDLLGEIAELTGLTRRLIADILSQIDVYKFDMFKKNPEDFILKVGRLINEEKATKIVKHIEYNILEDTYTDQLFFDNNETGKVKDKRVLRAQKGIYNYVKVDSDTEAKFQEELESHDDVKVYVKLPAGFFIPTPLGKYNPDWAIAFKEGSVKHIYFVAETKGSMSSLQLKGAEEAKIQCAKAHFRALKEKGILADGNIYDVVSSYEELMTIVRS